MLVRCHNQPVEEMPSASNDTHIVDFLRVVIACISSSGWQHCTGNAATCLGVLGLVYVTNVICKQLLLLPC